jgi:hypothetical protein
MAGQGDLERLETLSRHVVICNCNEKVRGIVEELQAPDVTDPPDVVLLVQDTMLWERNPAWHPHRRRSGCFLTLEGCPTNEQDLQRVRIEHARSAVILADPKQGQLADARSTLVAIAIERQNPHVHTIMELIASVNRVHLAATEVNEVVCFGEITEKLIAQSCITPGVKNILGRLLSTAEGRNSIFVVPLPAGLEGISYRELAKRVIASGEAVILCGFLRSVHEPIDPPSTGNIRRCTRASPARQIVVNPRSHVEPGKETSLEAGDQLIVLARTPPRLEGLG